MAKRHYQDLIVWQRAVALVPWVYSFVKNLPREENYALSDQLRRAVVSIPANIAEGQARQHPKEFLQHAAIPKGSLAELHTLLIVAQRLGYLAPESLLEAEAALNGVSRPLHGLMSMLNKVVQARRHPITDQEPATFNQEPLHGTPRGSRKT